MNKLIKQNLNLFLGIFILLQPILDLITGLCLHIFDINLTIGIIIRMLFLISIMYITVFIYKKKRPLIYYTIFILYSILYLLGNIIFKDINILSECQGLLRTFYFPLLLISLYELKAEIRISKLTLCTTLFLYLTLIFIPIIFNTGFKSYEVAKVGNLGFFNSANEIGGIISILTPIVFIVFYNKKNLILKILFSLLYLFVILTVGTKTPLLSLLITIGATFIWLIIHFFKNRKYKLIFIFSLIIITTSLSIIILIPKTNFYKNIKIHLDYLKVDNITDVLKDELLIDHFIFSERLTFYNEKSHIYDESSFYQKLFGIGYINDNKTTKMIEMDYYDIYLSHGLIGFLIFFSIPLYVLLKLAKEKGPYNFDSYMIDVSLSLGIILSLLTGHIITAPSVSLILIIIILSSDRNKKKSLFFASYNLDLGGIETALINLLNNINYDKYNVALFLEQKSGIFMQEVNEFVQVKELKVSNHSNIFIRKVLNFTKKLLFTIFNYQNYDFSCCYATYSLSSNKLALIASKNSSLYVHSNYKYLYKTEEEVRNFYDIRNINSFNHLIFVSNEAKDDFLAIYPNLKKKCLVFNNFINVSKIKDLSHEKINYYKPKDKTLFVFVGRLDDHSKKVSRIINLINNLETAELWIVGDGPDRKMYEEEVKRLKLESKVTFCGKQTNPYPYIKESDYVILTSDYEGFPVIYLEAITLNKPIITTIDVSDDKINIGKDYAYIVSKDEKKMIKEVTKILTKPTQNKTIDLEKIQKQRMRKLEKLFDEVK